MQTTRGQSCKVETECSGKPLEAKVLLIRAFHHGMAKGSKRGRSTRGRSVLLQQLAVDDWCRMIGSVSQARCGGGQGEHNLRVVCPQDLPLARQHQALEFDVRAIAQQCLTCTDSPSRDPISSYLRYLLLNLRQRRQVACIFDQALPISDQRDCADDARTP